MGLEIVLTLKHTSELLSDVLQEIEHSAAIYPIFEDMLQAKKDGNLGAYFTSLKAIWALQMPKLKQGYHPYFIDWVLVFTPIEYAVWQDLRCYPIRFYPQFPVGRRFIDFADPDLKIGIECDGKEYHNTERDTARDIELSEHGWTIYHLSGRDCLTPDLDDDAEEGATIEWHLNASGGLVKAIYANYYDGQINKRWVEFVPEILENHRLIHHG